MDLKGKAYLPVAYRLIWFREEHPDWGIATRPVEIDTAKKHAVFHCTITNAEGRTVSEGTKLEGKFGDYVEKAETGSIGRALGALGYGTQFCLEFEEEDRICDSPMPTGNGPTAKARNGGYRPEPNQGEHGVQNEPDEPPYVAPADKPMPEAQKRAISHLMALAGDKGYDNESVKDWVRTKYGVSSRKDLSKGMISEMIEALTGMPDVPKQLDLLVAPIGDPPPEEGQGADPNELVLNMQNPDGTYDQVRVQRDKAGAWFEYDAPSDGWCDAREEIAALAETAIAAAAT